MTAYIIFMLLMLLQSVMFKADQSPRGKRQFLTVTCIELIAFTGLRGYAVGADTGSYLNTLNFFRELPITQIFFAKQDLYDLEFGYEIFTRIAALLGLNETAFLVVVSAAIYIPFFVFLQKYCPYPALGIMAYFAFGIFGYSLGIFRQMIALSICLMSVPFILKRKPVEFFLMILLASTFHITAVCWILLYIMYEFKIETYIKYVLPAAILCVPLGRVIVELLLMIMPKYARYLDRNYSAAGGTYSMLLLLIMIFVLLWMYYFRVKGKTNELSGIERLAIAGFGLAMILQAVSYSFALIGRAVCYFTIFLTILIPNFVKKGITKESRMSAYVFFTVMLFAMTVLLDFRGNKYICPFYFFWQ